MPRLSAVFLVLLLLAMPAEGDTLSATYQGQLGDKAQLEESQHHVQVHVEGNDFVYVVRRALVNHGPRVEEAVLSLELPFGAVATDLRARIGEAWFVGELMAREEASERYARLTESGPLASAGPVLLSFLDESQLELKVFPIAPGKSVQVEYRLRVPGCYADGYLVGHYPRHHEPVEDEPALREARLRFGADLVGVFAGGGRSIPRSLNEIASVCAEKSEWISDPDHQDPLWVEHKGGEAISARVGAHVMGGNRSVAELIIDVAPQLEPLPQEAQLLFLVDSSYSVGKEALARQLTLIEAYLRHLPDASFDIIFYQRRAMRAFGKLRSAKQAPQLLSRLRHRLPSLGNGSNLDEGLRVAAEALASHGPGTQRIIAMTDSRLRLQLDADAVSSALSAAPTVLVHLLDLDSGASEFYFERDDEHPLASAILPTGGMAVSMFGQGKVRQATPAILGLVRPIQIDDLQLRSGDHLSSDFAAIAEVAGEGYGFRSLSLLSALDEDLQLRGKIWGRDIRVEVALDQQIASQVPALLFGRQLASSLGAREQAALARAGHVVSPQTSLLARNRTLGPSSYDYDMDDEFGTLGGFSTGSVGHSISCGGGSIATRVEPADSNYGAALSGLLADHAAVCEALHGGDLSELSLSVETTGAEIVAVETAVDNSLSECVVEAAWSLSLSDFFQHSGGVHAVGL